MNEYLKEFQTKDTKLWSLRSYQLRQVCIEKYGFAIPTDEVVAKIASFGKIVEMGAGTGYWAKLISDAGVDIVAFDKDPVESGENFYKFRQSWFSVMRGGPEQLACYTDRTLFLCWPPYETSFGGDCLKHYKGDTLLYVGEGSGGCCGGRSFWEELHYHWKRVEYLPIPCWDGISDAFWVYKRRAAPNTEKYRCWYDSVEEDEDE